MAVQSLRRVFSNLFNVSTRKMHSDTRPLVETEKLGHVFIMAINRPEKRNCVNTATANALWDAVDHFEKEEDLWVAILHGKGGNFCAGYDLSELASFDKENLKMPFADHLENGRGPMGPSRKVIQKPIIAAVDGYAVAGGLELALMCDMRVMEESAIMGVFCRRFGVPLLDGGTVRLPQLIGLSRAMDMILTGRPVTAKEAYQMGLANRVVPTGSALGDAMNIAQALCKKPQECMRRDRLSAIYSTFEAKSIKDAFHFEFENAKHVVQQESIDGGRKFVEGFGRGGDLDITKKSRL